MMLGELVLVDLGKVLRNRAPVQILNIPQAERDSGVRIVGVCENGAGGLTVHVESIELESVRAACEKQTDRNVLVKTDSFWASRA